LSRYWVVLGTLAFIIGASAGMTGMASAISLSDSARELMADPYVRALTWMVAGFVCAGAGLLILSIGAWSEKRSARMGEAGGPSSSGPNLPKKTLRPVLGGALAIIAGYICIVGAFAGLVGDSESIPLGLPDGAEKPGFPLSLIGALLSAPFGLASMLGGFMAFLRKSWDLASWGSILGAVGAAMVFWLPGAAVGLTGVALVLFSGDEFS